MSYRVALIKGDGIGPEQAAATTEVLTAVAKNFGVSLDFIPVEAGIQVLPSGPVARLHTLGFGGGVPVE